MYPLCLPVFEAPKSVKIMREEEPLAVMLLLYDLGTGLISEFTFLATILYCFFANFIYCPS